LRLIPGNKAGDPLNPPSADEDAGAVRRVVAGDLSAFAEIVGRWQHRLVNLAWRFCRDRAMAEDMAQEAFVKAFRALPGFRGDALFSTWLTAIAMNTYRSHLRDRPPVVVDLDLVRIAAHGQDPLAGVQERERAAILRQAVLALPARYREPLILYYFHEMDLAQTARVLGMPEGTLKARLHRGRELLRQRSAARLSTLIAGSPRNADGLPGVAASRKNEA
jgi:RNA polymerase sigma-70 factor (ECF subfamily)